MNIRIESLSIQNFKGIRDLSINFAGKNAYIFGDNETGKTSISDAFIWCLFDKDSAGRSAFDVKPLDENNEPIHLLETVVELELQIDDELLRLRKLLKEKWTRKRGDAEDTFTGNETSYWVNDVPVKAGEYKAKIAAYLDEPTFRQITSAEHFMTMKKPDMRAALVSMIGQITDDDIAGNDQKLQELVSMMRQNKYTADDVLKVTRDKVTGINNEIKAIPARIDEVRRNIPDALDWQTLEAKKVTLTEKIAEIEKTFLSARSAAESNRKRVQQGYELINKADALKRQLAADVNDAERKSKEKLLDIDQQINKANINLAFETSLLSTNKHLYVKTSAMITDYRNQYKKAAELQAKIKDEEWQGLPESDLNCRTCGQLLPEDDRKQLESKALAAFTKNKAERLEKAVNDAAMIAIAGKESRAKYDKLGLEIFQSEERIKEIKEQLALLEEQRQIAAAELQAEKQPEKLPEDFADHPDVVSLMEQGNALIVDAGDDSEVEKLLESKSAYQFELNDINANLLRRNLIEQMQSRVDELSQRNRDLANELVKQEGVKYTVERFIRRRGELLEAEINDLFTYIKFRLFKTNINGGIEDDCEALIKGVPYSTNASNSSRIRAGLDIVRTMQRIKNIQSPVFVDNAESATWLLPMDCQIVQLIVSENDKALRIELEG